MLRGPELFLKLIYECVIILFQYDHGTSIWDPLIAIISQMQSRRRHWPTYGWLMVHIHGSFWHLYFNMRAHEHTVDFLACTVVSTTTPTAFMIWTVFILSLQLSRMACFRALIQSSCSSEDWALKTIKLDVICWTLLFASWSFDFCVFCFSSNDGSGPPTAFEKARFVPALEMAAVSASAALATAAVSGPVRAILIKPIRRSSSYGSFRSGWIPSDKDCDWVREEKLCDFSGRYSPSEKDCDVGMSTSVTDTSTRSSLIVALLGLNDCPDRLLGRLVAVYFWGPLDWELGVGPFGVTWERGPAGSDLDFWVALARVDLLRGLDASFLRGELRRVEDDVRRGDVMARRPARTFGGDLRRLDRGDREEARGTNRLMPFMRAVTLGLSWTVWAFAPAAERNKMTKGSIAKFTTEDGKVCTHILDMWVGSWRDNIAPAAASFNKYSVVRRTHPAT